MSSCDRTASRPRRPYGTKKFDEPVSLSFTALVDFPLAGTVLEIGFDLLGIRARRNQHSRACSESSEGVSNALRPQFAEIQLRAYPQQSVQDEDNPRSAAQG